MGTPGKQLRCNFFKGIISTDRGLAMTRFKIALLSLFFTSLTLLSSYADENDSRQPEIFQVTILEYDAGEREIKKITGLRGFIEEDIETAEPEGIMEIILIDNDNERLFSIRVRNDKITSNIYREGLIVKPLPYQDHIENLYIRQEKGAKVAGFLMGSPPGALVIPALISAFLLQTGITVSSPVMALIVIASALVAGAISAEIWAATVGVFPTDSILIEDNEELLGVNAIGEIWELR